MDSQAQETTTATQPENAAAALLGGKLADEMPEVDLSTVSAFSQPAEKQQTASATASTSAASGSKPALVDAQGRTFNPLWHEVDSSGKPELRKGTNLLKCRRTPLKGAAQESRVQLNTTPPPASDPVAPGPVAAPEPAPVDPAKAEAMRDAGAATMAGLQIQMLRLALGEHTADSTEEREALTEAWRETFAYYGMGSVHPLVGLGLVTGAVVMKSIHQPEGRSRWQRFVLWARVKFGSAMLWMNGRTTPRQPDHEAA